LATQVTRKSVLALTFTAVGVVYGDIGTSPLYAMRECFHGPHAVAATHENVLGVLSLIVYALILVVSIKYIVVVMRADNQGEGGILALTALVPQRSTDARRLLILLGIFGAALLYGDGMITPAITVLSAVEGLNVVTPLFEPYVVPTAVVILIVVFSLQRYGTDRVGRGRRRRVRPAARDRVLPPERIPRVRHSRRRVPRGHRR
jgi:KUP system potassium uptake protein